MRLLLTLVAVAMLTVAVGCDKAADKPATPAPAPAAAAEGAETTSVTFPVEGEMQLVSLKLPNMT